MRTERLSACQPSTCSERGGVGAAVDRSATSVVVNSPGATYSRCFPPPRVTEESWEHSRTLTGRPPDSSPRVPLTDVARLRPSMLMTGPLPQATLNLAVLSSVSTCSPARAGIVSLASPSTGCPDDVPGCAALAQPGKLIWIWLVVSAFASVATPPRPIVACRVPAGLVTLILVGAAAKP